jgi:iron complex transport system substrate-binding protein
MAKAARGGPPSTGRATDRSGNSRRFGFAIAVLLALAGPVTGPAFALDAPKRVVSLNLCTDQLALTIGRPEQLVSVSRFSRDPNLSDTPEAAATVPVNDGRAEEIVPLAPDLVLSGSHTARSTVAILRRLGYRVEEFTPPRSFADIRADVLRMGDLLGRPGRAASLVAEFDARISALRAEAPAGEPPTAVVYHVGNMAEGRGTIADEILATAGWRNLAADLGIDASGSLPLEVLVMNRPDVVLIGAAEAGWTNPTLQNTRHPALRAALGGGARLSVLPDRWSICGSMAVTEVVRRLVDERRRLAGLGGLVR